MIAYLKGELASKSIGYVVIDVGGVGYKVFMSEVNMNELGNIGEQVKVHTYYRVMEDDISIFGFNTQEELRLFELLISVSGVGAKSAIAILGAIEPSDFAIAVISEDITTLKKLPGIGIKTAQRIVLELKDKLKKEQQIQELSNVSDRNRKIKSSSKTNDIFEEASSALQVLGYNVREIETALERVDNQNMSLEELIKAGLKELARK